MSKFEFIIGGRTRRINDLGRKMNAHFLKLHEAYFLNTGFDFNDFKEHSLRFFDDYKDDYTIQDKFFNNFTIIWGNFLAMQLFKRAEQLWNDALGIAYEWENRNQGMRIHKGTPYYFLGVTSILNGELDKGFLLMHQALEEDKKTHNSQTPETPAYFFVTLDYKKQNQFFRAKVREISEFLDQRLSYYRDNRQGCTLLLSDFKSKFLEQTGNLQKTVFYFVFTLFQIKRLSDINPDLRKNILSSLLETSIIFDLCLIVEAIIKERDTTRYRPNRPIYFSDRIKFLSRKARLTLHSKLGRIKQGIDSDFWGTLDKLINSTYQFANGTSLSQIEEDLAIAYAFRNFAAHTIESHRLIYENFEPICQRILNSLFFSIEKLY